MKTFNDLKVEDKIYSWCDGKCSIGIIKEITLGRIFIHYEISPIIGNDTKHYVSQTNRYKSISTNYFNGEIFADEEEFLKYIYENV